nr:hypothetical protein [Tanacetum cinerariifolium]
MLEQEPPSQTQGLVDEDDDDSEFHLLSDRELDAIYLWYSLLKYKACNLVGFMAFEVLGNDFWVVEEEAQRELDYDQLENMLEQEPPSQTQGLVDEDDDDSEFHLLSDRELDAYNTPVSQ